jgi:hypothetical protein
VQQEGDHHGEEQHRHGGEEPDDEGVPHRVPEALVGDEELVLRESHEGDVAHPVPVGEGQHDREQDREQPEDREQEIERGDREIQRERLAASEKTEPNTIAIATIEVTFGRKNATR